MKLGSAGKDPTASFGSILFLVETEASKWVGCRAVARPQFSFYSPAHPATILPWVRGQSRCRLVETKSHPEHTGCSACLAAVGNAGGPGRNSRNAVFYLGQDIALELSRSWLLTVAVLSVGYR